MSKGHSVPVELKCKFCTEWRTGEDENAEYGFCDYLGMFKTHKDESCSQIALWFLSNNRELNKTIIEKRRKEGWFPVACRLCGDISWFPKKTYRESDFKKGYECHKHRKVK